MKLDIYERLMRTFGEDAIEELIGKGLSDDELAERFGVKKRTLRRWKRKYPRFAEAIRIACADSDFEVISSIYNRAVGYRVKLPKTYKLKHIDYDEVTGKKLREYEELSVIEEEEYVPGDLRAGEFWLSVRQPENWGEDVTHEGGEIGVVEIPMIMQGAECRVQGEA